MVGDILQPTHLLFVLVVALLVLGPKRLPEVAKTLGKGLRDFRGAISGDSDHTDHTPPYLSGDTGPDHSEAPAPVSETPVGQTPAPAGGTPPSVSETPAPVSHEAPAPTPATTAPPAQTAAVDPQPVQPVDEPVQPIATPATQAPPPQSPPPQPTPADHGETQTHPAGSAPEQHE